MPSGFNSETLSLGQLLAGASVFQIPDYQRPYSWTTTEAEQLLDDLHVARDDALAPEAPDSGYFLGAVLLMEHAGREPDGSAGDRGRDIVDGQQRIVTLTILLAVLRDLVADKGGSIEQIVHPLIWSGNGREAKPRVSLRGREGDFLRSNVQEPGASIFMPSEDDLTDGETRILAVREYLTAELFANSAVELEEFARYLEGSCHFAVITTQTVDRAHRIFFVLNERGRPLARNDILKAQLLGAIDAGRRGRHTEAWERIERRLGGDFESLFSHIRAIEDRGRSKVITGIAELVADRGGAEAFFEEVLEPYATIFAALKEPADGPGFAHDIFRHLTYLGWLGSADWMPAAMLYWRKCEGEPAALAGFLVRLDRLTFGLRLLGIGADKRRARFYSIVTAIKQDAALDDVDSPLELARDELRNIQYNLRNLHARSQLTCKLVLLRLDDEMMGAMQRHDPGSLTVEHVLPQKPSRNSQWRTWFPAADEREACTQSLGNLVLVTKDENDRARNLELARKQEVYFARGRDAALALTRDIDGLDAWQAPEILAREERLLAAVNQLWRLAPPKGRNPADTKEPAKEQAPEAPPRRRRHPAARD